MIRLATPHDSVAAMDVVRRSIEFLCVVDHQIDPDTRARWLANKVPPMFETWIANSENFCVVAEVTGAVSGVGLLHRSGMLRLFYVAPDCQRRGLGRKIHEALEAQARTWGLDRLYLESTRQACAFYESVGYRSAGAEKILFGTLRGYPYEKFL
ncbi:MAG TPA: GNAT family N-acetyltransferase [Halothiobacillus sp.]|nr:GNAT family N-acetyltransferase [Halothiobacillus sp.]